MTTITIDDPKIEEVYSAQEIRIKFLEFLQYEFGEHEFTLHQISIDDAPVTVQKEYENISDMNFVEV